MAIREVDAISDAIVETEREIAGDAWGQEDTERDAGGDRSLENMGEGLEGQHEDETDGEDAEGEEESESEAKPETTEGEVKPGEEGKGEQPKPDARGEQQPEGRVPSGKLREANGRARVLQAELDTFKTKDEQRGGEFKSLTEKLDLALRQIDDLRRTPRSEPKPADKAEPKAAPDIFEDPKGFVEFLQQGFQTKLDQVQAKAAADRVEDSMALAHTTHKDVFEKAFEAVRKLDSGNPEDRATVQRIYGSRNPGEELVNWHKRAETLRVVGNDPAKFRETTRAEVIAELKNDPEFKKQLLADLRGEASRPGPDGQPRTVNRLPPALNRAPGSNLGAAHSDANQFDDSDQAVAASAWR